MALSQSSPSTSSIAATSNPQLSTLSANPASSPQHHQPFAAASSTTTSPVKEATTVRTAPNTAATGPYLNDLSRQSNNYRHRQSTLSISSSKQNRTGLFTLAALARDKTTNAIASFSEPTIRPRPSSSSLYRSAQSSPTTPSNNTTSLPLSADVTTSGRENTEPSRTSSSNASVSPSSHSRTETLHSASTRQSLLETNPPSQPYADTAADTPPPITFAPSGNYNKMHQTSSRLLRMTSDDRPFTRVSIGGRGRCGELN
jgi:hypothetical protein